MSYREKEALAVKPIVNMKKVAFVCTGALYVALV
jgi:hypothetical protein